MKILPTSIINYTQIKNTQLKNKQSVNSDATPFSQNTSVQSTTSDLKTNVFYKFLLSITDIPVQYTKIREIAIPGLKDKASVFRLSNGQKVIIAPKKGPTFVKTTYNVGSLNETENIRGISHFIEHNLFNGSKNLAPREYDKKVSELGAYTNASTGFSATDYFLKLQLLNDSSLENAIKLNAWQTQFPTFPAEQLEKEKEPVKSEIDMYKDMPNDVAASIVLKNLFNINTNSTNFILGTKENINSFNRETVMDYYNTWYTPDNAVTVITGDVDTKETIKLVSEYFNKQNNYFKINKRHYEPIKYNTKPIRQDIIQPNATSASVTLGFAIPEGTKKLQRDNINTLIAMLSSTGSDLSKRLDEYGLKPNIYTEYMQNKTNGAGAVIITVDMPERHAEDVLDIIYEEIQKISKHPVSQIELENVKKRLSGVLKSTSETSSSLNSLLTEMALTDNYNYYNETDNNIKNISANDIMKTAKSFFDLNKVSVCVSHEKNANRTEILNNYNNSKNNNVVSFGSSSIFKDIMSNVREYKLPNNIETSYIQGNNSAKSSFNMDIQSDDLNEITSPALLIINELLNRGSLFKNKEAYNNILNTTDTDLLFMATQNGLNILADFNDENTDKILPLISETIMYPNFTENEFLRAKNVIRDYIQNEEASAYDKLNRELYPEIKLYASKEEKIKQLEALTLQDIVNIYNYMLSTSKASAQLTTPVNEKPYIINNVNNELAKLPLFKPFTLEHTYNYNIYKPVNSAKTVTQAEEKSQAEIIQAYKFKNSQNIKDIAKIAILNMILGGSMSSRLFTDLRENKKLAYHVSSSLSEQKDSAAIMLKIGTTTDSADIREGSPSNAIEALKGFNSNIHRLKTENVSDKELENAKIRYKSKILDETETNFDITDTVKSTKNTPYGLNFNNLLMEEIDKLTPDDIRAAANYVFQNQPVTSIVASKNTLKTLGLI